MIVEKFNYLMGVILLTFGLGAIVGNINQIGGIALLCFGDFELISNISFTDLKETHFPIFDLAIWVIQFIISIGLLFTYSVGTDPFEFPYICLIPLCLSGYGAIRIFVPLSVKKQNKYGIFGFGTLLCSGLIFLAGNLNFWIGGLLLGIGEVGLVTILLTTKENGKLQLNCDLVLWTVIYFFCTTWMYIALFWADRVFSQLQSLLMMGLSIYSAARIYLPLTRKHWDAFGRIGFITFFWGGLIAILGGFNLLVGIPLLVIGEIGQIAYLKGVKEQKTFFVNYDCILWTGIFLICTIWSFSSLFAIDSGFTLLQSQVVLGVSIYSAIRVYFPLAIKKWELYGKICFIMMFWGGFAAILMGFNYWIGLLLVVVGEVGQVLYVLFLEKEKKFWENYELVTWIVIFITSTVWSFINLFWIDLLFNKLSSLLMMGLSIYSAARIYLPLTRKHWDAFGRIGFITFFWGGFIAILGGFNLLVGIPLLVIGEIGQIAYLKGVKEQKTFFVNYDCILWTGIFLICTIWSFSSLFAVNSDFALLSSQVILALSIYSAARILVPLSLKNWTSYGYLYSSILFWGGLFALVGRFNTVISIIFFIFGDIGQIIYVLKTEKKRNLQIVDLAIWNGIFGVSILTSCILLFGSNTDLMLPLSLFLSIYGSLRVIAPFYQRNQVKLALINIDILILTSIAYLFSMQTFLAAGIISLVPGLEILTIVLSLVFMSLVVGAIAYLYFKKADSAKVAFWSFFGGVGLILLVAYSNIFNPGYNNFFSSGQWYDPNSYSSRIEMAMHTVRGLSLFVFSFFVLIHAAILCYPQDKAKGGSLTIKSLLILIVLHFRYGLLFQAPHVLDFLLVIPITILVGSIIYEFVMHKPVEVTIEKSPILVDVIGTNISSPESTNDAVSTLQEVDSKTKPVESEVEMISTDGKSEIQKSEVKKPRSLEVSITPITDPLAISIVEAEEYLDSPQIPSPNTETVLPPPIPVEAIPLEPGSGFHSPPQTTPDQTRPAVPSYESVSSSRKSDYPCGVCNGMIHNGVCQKCGRRLCSHCGKMNGPTDRFCTNCGNPLEQKLYNK